MFSYTGINKCLPGDVSSLASTFTALGMCGGEQHFEFPCDDGSDGGAVLPSSASPPPPYVQTNTGQESCAMVVQVRGAGRRALAGGRWLAYKEKI